MAEKEAGRALWGGHRRLGQLALRLNAWLTASCRVQGCLCVLYVVVVVALLSIAPHLHTRSGLAVDGLAALAAGSWCVVNFWRCRQAHCVMAGVGGSGLPSWRSPGPASGTA